MMQNSLTLAVSAQSFKISCSSGNGFWLVYEDLSIDFGRTNFLQNRDMGRLPFDQKFRNFRNRDKLYGYSLGKVPENTEIVEFPKSKPFNRKFRKFRDESQMERKFPGKIFQKFGYTSQGWPLFRNLCKFPIFYSALASSFGCDHNSELDISCKDGAHSIKETL